MKSKYLTLILIFLFNPFFTNAQTSDSLATKSLIKKSIVPISLIGVGVIITNSQFEQNLQTNIRNNVGNDFAFHIDEYTQYVPIAEMYLADMFNVKSQNHWFNQTKYLLISNIISSGITFGLKKIIDKTRPNGLSESFPSGHTTFAFTNATVLFNEFQHTSPFLAYSGYAFAATTGTFRIINNEHWLSDVLVGAGIGMLVTHIVYHFEPLKNFNPFQKSKNISLIPTIDRYGYGFYFSYIF